MKKVIAFLSIVGVLTFFGTSSIKAQEADVAEQTTTEIVNEEAPFTEQAANETETTAEVASESFSQVLKNKFVEGGPMWMAPILICLIFGLALVIERVLYLNLATTNTKKLLSSIEAKIAENDIEGAKKICKETRGPVASIFYQGLDRVDEGMENVEKAIISYGGVQTGRLESNLTWIALFIAVAPMLGFLGTVVGMVQAFDDIERQGDISPTIVAGGMKVALLTTVFGLIVAIILQFCYNYCISKIENIVNTMEDASISFMDILIKRK